MKDANVIVVVVDAREGIVEQDLHLIGYALEAGRAIVIAVNKWDNMILLPLCFCVVQIMQSTSW